MGKKPMKFYSYHKYLLVLIENYFFFFSCDDDLSIFNIFLIFLSEARTSLGMIESIFFVLNI